MDDGNEMIIETFLQVECQRLVFFPSLPPTGLGFHIDTLPFLFFMHSLLLAAWLLLAAKVLLIRAELVNRTIDDEYGDPTGGGSVDYGPNWEQGNDCVGCAVSPDRSQAFDGTWHDSTANGKRGARNMTITFSGAL